MNRYTQLREFQPQLSTPPIEYIGPALEQLQQRYDTNFAYAEEVKNNYINALAPDRARANELSNEYEKEIDNIVAKYNGDYSQATKDLYALNSRIRKDFSPGGEAGTIQNNYTVYQKALEENQKLLGENKITQAQLQLWNQHIMGNYQGATKNPDGTFSMLNPESISLYPQEMEKRLMEVAQSVPKKKQKITVPQTDENGFLTHTTVETEFVDEEAVGRAVQATLSGDPQFNSYLAQMARWQGLDPNEVINAVTQDYVNTYSPTYGGMMTDITEVKAQRDPAYVENLRYKHRLSLQARDQAFRKEMEDRANQYLPEGQAPLSLLQVTNPKFTQYKKAEKGFWTGEYPSARAVAKDPQSGYDNSLLNQIISENPDMQNNDIWTIYNNSLTKDRYGAGIYYTPFRTSDAQEEEARRKLPLLATGNVRVHKVSTANGAVEEITDPGEIRDLYDSFWDSDKLKPKVNAIGKSSLQNGNVPYGSIFPGTDGNSYYVVEENDEQMLQINEGAAKSAFGFINNPRSNGGTANDVFALDFNGQPVYIVGKKVREYDPQNQAYYKDVRYYQVTGATADNQPIFDETDPLTVKENENGEARPWTQADVEQALIGGVRDRYMPVKARGTAKEYNNVYESSYINY